MNIICTIIPLQLNVTNISYKFIYNYIYSHNLHMEYNNIFQFDAKPRGKELLWFSSEIEEHYYSYERFVIHKVLLHFVLVIIFTLELICFRFLERLKCRNLNGYHLNTIVIYKLICTRNYNIKTK